MIKIMKLMKKYVGTWLVLKTSQVIEEAEMEAALVVVVVQMIEAAKKTVINVILFQKLQYPAVLGNEKEIHLLKKVHRLQFQLKSMSKEIQYIITFPWMVGYVKMSMHLSRKKQ